jgi:hypothetical protein
MRAPASSLQSLPQEHIDLARADFPLVFKDILDLDHFERNMFFSDPISRFTFFRGAPRSHGLSQ